MESVENAESASATLAPSTAPSKKDERRKWYVIHTYSGYENKVKANLERRIHSMNMQEKIFRVLVPMEDEVEFKDGKRKITPKKVFPGYVLVEMDMDDQSWYVVRNTSGVTGFVGSPGAGRETRSRCKKKKSRRSSSRWASKRPSSRSTSPRATASRSPRSVLRLHRHRRRNPAGERKGSRALISIFGRETPVELEFYQIEKV